MPDEKKPKLFGFTKYRRAWIQAHNLEVAIYTGLPPFEKGEGEFLASDMHFGADNVILNIKRGRTGNLFIDLTTLTEEELSVFRDIITLAIDTAMPAAQYIDKASVEANDTGEEFSPRPFRVRPVFHIRWDKTITIPDSYKENQHEQDGGKRPPPVEPFFARPE